MSLNGSISSTRFLERVLLWPCKAHHVHAQVIPAMNTVRTCSDKIERLLPDALRVMPNYREMLFVK